MGDFFMKKDFVVSGVYIAAIIGAGFASGSEFVYYFAKFGKLGFLGIVLSSLLFGLMAAWILGISKEKGYMVAMDALDVKPYFNLGMRLGEGSGCPISFKIMETACATMNGMATFAEGAIDADYLQEAKKGNFF